VIAHLLLYTQGQGYGCFTHSPSRSYSKTNNLSASNSAIRLHLVRCYIRLGGPKVSQSVATISRSTLRLCRVILAQNVQRKTQISEVRFCNLTQVPRNTQAGMHTIYCLGPALHSRICSFAVNQHQPLTFASSCRETGASTMVD
jgi:hypothetical protein